MLSPYLHAALAHERHQAFLAQAETGRRARQARSHRQQAATPGARRSPRRRPAWLRPGPGRLPGPRPRAAAPGRPVEPGALRYEIILGSAEESGRLWSHHIRSGWARRDAATPTVRTAGPRV